MKMVIAIIIGAVVDLIVFCSLCRSAKRGGEMIIQEAWDNSTKEYDWDGEIL